eukprot:CAMPEP_0180540468 /NCGR_PEP_ID=MMETSP1036_2-20121128/67427_1 /TAXON_ID=632150 /ORGANISM="Azadinium spinosum, Strain 3D9" /LENGTH=62 /DNA_ID=CAMNT_0022555255 /DNA_START=225 /DNA_END=410 /DNA_ORIENTATION=-
MLTLFSDYGQDTCHGLQQSQRKCVLFKREGLHDEQHGQARIVGFRQKMFIPRAPLRTEVCDV